MNQSFSRDSANYELNIKVICPDTEIIIGKGKFTIQKQTKEGWILSVCPALDTPLLHMI